MSGRKVRGRYISIRELTTLDLLHLSAFRELFSLEEKENRKVFNRSLVRTGVGAGFEIALEPSKLQKQGDYPEEGRFYFLRQTLVCTKPCSKEF